MAVRLYANQRFIEIVSKIGPIDISDGMGKEVVHRYSSSSIASGDEWLTDSSWEEMMVRRRNYRFSWTYNMTNPVAGNYVPMNAMAVISGNQTQLSILSDRSRGCASLNSGEVG